MKEWLLADGIVSREPEADGSWIVYHPDDLALLAVCDSQEEARDLVEFLSYVGPHWRTFLNKLREMP